MFINAKTQTNSNVDCLIIQTETTGHNYYYYYYKQVNAARMADAISPRRHQCELATDEQTNERTNRQIEGRRHRFAARA